jgi:hypothetical protein
VSDYALTRIVIGGVTNAEGANKLAEEAASLIGYIELPRVEKLFARDSKGCLEFSTDCLRGSFSLLEALCREQDLTFVTYVDASDDALPEVAWWRPGMEGVCSRLTDSEGTPLIPLPYLSGLKHSLDLGYIDDAKEQLGLLLQWPTAVSAFRSRRIPDVQIRILRLPPALAGGASLGSLLPSQHLHQSQALREAGLERRALSP